jgi:hypothetical protein
LPGAELAAIAAGCAIAKAVCLDQHDIAAGFGEMGCRGQAGETAAYDDDIGLSAAFKRRIFRSRAGSILIP